MNRQIPYYRARYYSPNIGRFISRDPLTNAERSQGPNLYWYVGDNSTNKLDPLGTSIWGTLDTILYIIPVLGTLRNLIPPSGTYDSDYTINIDSQLCCLDSAEAIQKCKESIALQESGYILKYCKRGQASLTLQGARK